MNAQRSRIKEAMTQNPRAQFLPEDQSSFATRDSPLPIGFGQTNSQPTTVLAMMELLDARPGCNVLDLGSGSGWTSAILGALVGETGQVTAVEIVPELVERSRSVLGDSQPWVAVQQADPCALGALERAPFDRILVSAQATTLPEELVFQLKNGGVLVVPVAGTMLRIVRTGAETFDTTEHGSYIFVPLIEP